MSLKMLPTWTLLLGLLLALSLTVDGFIWPRVVPHYYPLPMPVESTDSMAASSMTSPSGVHNSPQYMYDWNSYNQNYPQSSVLYPNSDHSSAMQPPTGGGHQGGSSSPFSGLSRLFQKPWLTWKLAKFGFGRSPSSSPCSSGSSSPSMSAASLFPSLTSSSHSSSVSPTYQPCTTKATICCTGMSGHSRPNYIQTHVTYNPPTSHDRHSSQIHYPNNYVSYSSGSPSASPQASETSYEFISS